MIRTSMLTVTGALAFGLVCFLFANDASAQCYNYGYNSCNTGYSGCYNNCGPRRVVLRRWNRCNTGCYNNCNYNHCNTGCYNNNYNHCNTGCYNTCNTGCNTGCYTSYAPSYNHCGNYNTCGNYNNCGNYNTCGTYNCRPRFARCGYGSRYVSTCGGCYNNCGCNTGHVTTGCGGCAGQVIEGSVGGGAMIAPEAEANSVEAAGDAEVATPPNPDDT